MGTESPLPGFDETHGLVWEALRGLIEAGVISEEEGNVMYRALLPSAKPERSK